jgi:4-hydroxy-tetrahydrodipicolinate reductase
MGRTIAELLATTGAQGVSGVDRGGDVEALARSSDVLIDFSTPEALAGTLDAGLKAGIPIMVGTTGLTAQHERSIDEASAHIAIVQTGNTSLGVTLLAHLVREAAARLAADWDIEIIELHHRMKVDAPSGTALLLGEAAAGGRGIVLEENRETGRDGAAGARKKGAIGFASLRGGTAAGEHSVLFAGEQERLVLSHVAEDRAIFARGAVCAAEWLIGRPPGRYSMGDVLGLQSAE